MIASYTEYVSFNVLASDFKKSKIPALLHRHLCLPLWIVCSLLVQVLKEKSSRLWSVQNKKSPKKSSAAPFNRKTANLHVVIGEEIPGTIV